MGNTNGLIHQIMAKFTLEQKEKKNPRTLKLPAQIENHICCFFDGAAKSTLVCGARSVLWLTDGRKLKWKLRIGRGKNNKAKLMYLWATFFIAFREGYSRLQVMGDSCIIIDWFLGSADLQAEGLS